MLGQQRQAAHFTAFGVQVMFRERHCLETEILGELREFDDFVEHLLEAIITARDGAQLFALVHRGRYRRVEKEHELHRFPL